MLRQAVLSPCGRYRYRLEREWAPLLPKVGWCLLNPSKATHEVDDTTAAKMVGFASRWGYGSIIVVNLFAWRSTDPLALRTAVDPVGPDNDRHILACRQDVGLMVAAWGNDGALRGRDRQVLDALLALGALHALGTTKGGHPRHPVRLGYATELVELRAGR